VSEPETLETYGPRINRWDLFRVFARSFLIQSAWNFERGLNYGFAFALAPILRKLYLKADQPRLFPEAIWNTSTPSLTWPRSSWARWRAWSWRSRSCP
jgi:hypothetical protein